MCAGALNILSRIDDPLLAEVREKSAWVFEELTGAPGIESVAGMGLMIGVKPQYRSARAVAEACIARGVIVLTAHDRVRLLPALNIPFDLLKQGIAVLKEECAHE